MAVQEELLEAQLSRSRRQAASVQQRLKAVLGVVNVGVQSPRLGFEDSSFVLD
jgi:hypothetical protein